MSGDITASICAVGMLVTAGAVLLKNFGFKGAGVFTAAAIAAMTASVMSPLSAVFLSVESSFPSELLPYGESAVKAVGIGYLSGICSDIAKELGEGGVSKVILLAARLEMIVIAVPFIEEVMNLAAELISGG